MKKLKPEAMEKDGLFWRAIDDETYSRIFRTPFFVGTGDKDGSITFCSFVYEETRKHLSDYFIDEDGIIFAHPFICNLWRSIKGKAKRDRKIDRCLYVLETPDRSVKFGISMHPLNREKQLSGEIYFCSVLLPFDDVYTVEQQLCNSFKDYQIKDHGEEKKEYYRIPIKKGVAEAKKLMLRFLPKQNSLSDLTLFDKDCHSDSLSYLWNLKYNKDFCPHLQVELFDQSLNPFDHFIVNP